MVLHHIADTHGGDHTVEDEADTAHDGGGDGADQSVKLGGEGQDDGVDSGQTDHIGVVDTAEGQDAGVLTVGGVGGAAEHTGNGGGQAVAHQGAVQAGALDEVLAAGGGDSGHITDVLHHGGDGDGGHDDDGGHIELGQDDLLQAHQLGLAHGGEVHLMGENGHDVSAHNTQQDGDDLDHALAPDVGNDDDGDGHQGQGPVGAGVQHGGAGEVQADEDDDGAGDDGGEEAHDLLGTHQLEEEGHQQVQEAGHHHAAQGIGELFSAGHIGVDAGLQTGHGFKAAQEGEGGAQECGDLELGADVEQQRADTGEQQRGLDGQGQAVAGHQDGHQNGGAEHGEHVLQAQQEHPGHTQLPGVVDGLVAKVFLHGKTSLSFSCWKHIFENRAKKIPVNVPVRK